MWSHQSERLLNEIYYNVKHPAGFSNASWLYHAVKWKGITFQDAHEFLSRQHAHQLTRPNCYNYTRRRTVSMGYFSVYSRMKSSSSERFNRTLQEKINWYMIANDTCKFIDVVLSLVSGYNNTIHTVTKMRPAEIDMFNAPALTRRLFGRKSASLPANR